MSSYLVSFFLDASSEEYSQMTREAVHSFLEHSTCDVGLMCREESAARRVVESVRAEHAHRLVVHVVQGHRVSSAWNETQSKLELQRFFDMGYSAVFWLDSDCITYHNVDAFLRAFVDDEEALFFLVPDLVMHDARFLARWPADAMVPQACLMGFKRRAAERFFPLWVDHWRRWITPHAFASVADPRPEFAASAFCIEQYAFGMALQEFIQRGALDFERVVMLFARHSLLLSVGGAQLAPQAHSSYSSYSSAPSSFSSSPSSFSSGAQLPGQVRVDHFGPGIVHTYSVNYARVRRWWDNNYAAAVADEVSPEENNIRAYLRDMGESGGAHKSEQQHKLPPAQLGAQGDDDDVRPAQEGEQEELKLIHWMGPESDRPTLFVSSLGWETRVPMTFEADTSRWVARVRLPVTKEPQFFRFFTPPLEGWQVDFSQPVDVAPGGNLCNVLLS